MPDTAAPQTPRAGDLAAVRDFWDEASCGEELLHASRDREGYRAQSPERYRLEPYTFLMISARKRSGPGGDAHARC
jgi:hypothetical protein